MQIIGIEAGNASSALKVRNGQPPAVQLDQTVAAQLLQRAVDVDRGEARRVGEVDLGERKVAALVADEAGGAQLEQQLAEQMGDPLAGVALADIDAPIRG